MIPQIFTLDLLQLASGDNLSIQVYKFIGKKTGKKAYLQSNLHGAEIVGNAIIHQLITYLSSLDDSQLKGEIWLVPVCNPLGTNQRNNFFPTGRFNSYDGRDWNRIFWDYEKECEDLELFANSQLNFETEVIRNNYLQKIKTAFNKQLEKAENLAGVPYYQYYRCQLQSLCLDANYLIDIHSSSNQALDYLYCFQTCEDSARYFGLDYGIIMTEYDGDACDEAFMKPWLALEKQLENLGKKVEFDVEAWTLELGSGMKMNPESVEKGVAGIKSYLRQKEILTSNEGETNLQSKNIKLFTREQVAKYYATSGGMIENRVPLGTTVETGDKLYQLLRFNRSENLPDVLDVYAQNSGLVFDVSTNYSVNQGEYVLSIFED